MSRHEDNEKPELECPTCSHTFHTFSRLDAHMAEHEGPRRCRNCGKQLRDNEYHRC